MKRILKKIIPVLFAAAIVLLSGCAPESIDDLMRLPKLSEEYIELQSVIDGVLKTGAVYAAPISGSYRQSVQLYDINGDGTNEALAFFRVTDEKPLRIYIFSQTDTGYEVVSTIDGDGSSIGSIGYIDMDGDGWTEIVVVWHMGTGIKMLGIYSLKSFKAAPIAMTDCDQYGAADMDGDGCTELMVVRKNTPEKAGVVELYKLGADGEPETALAKLSPDMGSISRLAVGALFDKTTGFFVEGEFGGSGLITDIFTFDGKQLTNITAAETGSSESTVRSYAVYCRDIDGDGIMEVPLSRNLKSKGDAVYRVLDWYRYDVSGTGMLNLTTYHNYSDSWYLVLPQQWSDKVTIRREDSNSGERGIIFSQWNGPDEPVTDFLIIYAITGENREDMATRDGRMVLHRSSETIYAAKLTEAAEQLELAPDYAYLKANFSRIYSEWITGLT